MTSFVAMLAASGCSDEVDIIGECTVGDVRRVHDVPALPSVGLLDGRLFVSIAVDVPSEDPTVRRSEWSGYWLDENLEPASDMLWLGSGLIGAVRARWLRRDGTLVGHIWTRSEPPPPWSEETISLWVVMPPPDAEAVAHPINLAIPPPPDDNPAIRGFALGSLHQPGGEIVLPDAISGDDVIGAVVAVPPECGERFGNFFRLHLFSTHQIDAVPILWGEDPCALEGLDVGALWLFEEPSNGLSVLFRSGAADDGRLRLLRLHDDLTIRDGPRLVGKTHVTTADDGFQPRAVAVPGGRVLFLERIRSQNDCHHLRIMNADGTCAEDAPYQLPCIENENLITGYVELVGVPGGAVLIWGQNTRPPELRITTSTDYREGIYAVLLTPEGRRGSAIVEVTDEGATALPAVPRTETLGPYPVKPTPSATSEGDEVVVAWRDRRESAPGVYVRRLTCTVDGD